MGGWRTLGAAWAGVIVLAGGAGVALQVMGPPPVIEAHASEARTSHSEDHAAVSEAKHNTPHSKAAAPPAEAAPHGTERVSDSAEAETTPASPDTIAAPQAALLEPAPDITGVQMPRVAPDGRTPMRTYARRVDPADKRPRVAMLVVGLGLSDSLTKAAIEALPPAITLGISPYTHDRDGLPTNIRAHGHEYVVGLPMESQGYPMNDSGPRALLTGAEPGDNARNLEWVLTRVQGEVGLTGASDGLRGERFAEAQASWEAVHDELSSRGLLYIDPRPGAAITGASVAVTVVVDDPPDKAQIDAKLAQLEQAARDGSPALGLVGTLRPVTIERVAAWARGLDARGINLVPVSALIPKLDAPGKFIVRAPRPQPVKAEKTEKGEASEKAEGGKHE